MGVKEMTIQPVYVNGEWILADDSSVIPVVNPANDEVISSVPNCGTNEAKRAVDAAYKALAVWSKKRQASAQKNCSSGIS